MSSDPIEDELMPPELIPSKLLPPELIPSKLMTPELSLRMSSKMSSELILSSNSFRRTSF